LGCSACLSIVAITTAGRRESLPRPSVKGPMKLFSFAVDGPPLMVLFDKGDKILKSLDFQKVRPKKWIRPVTYRAGCARPRRCGLFALGNLKDNDARDGRARRSRPPATVFWGVRNEALRALGRVNTP